MSGVDPSNLPYKARQPRARPQRALPPPPDEDIAAEVAIDLAGQFASPPSPPKPGSMQLAPPPPMPADPTGAGSNNLSRANSGSGASEGSEGRRERPPVPATVPLVDPSHLNPYHSTLPEMQPPTILTPLRAHYLKKTLVNLQIAHELGVITDPILGANALGLLGPPFVLPEEAKRLVADRIGSDAIPSAYSTGDLPFMRYMFHQFMLPFPFLAAAPPTFWSHKVQPFLSSFLASTGAAQHATKTPQELEIAESLMTKEEKKEAEEKKKLWAKTEKHLGLMIGVGIKLVGGEEVVRIGQSELRRIEEAQEARRKKYAEKQAAEGHPPPMIAFDVNVVGVRTIHPKSRVRHKTHEEFLIRTQRTGVADVFVSRRYGDFRRLAEELRIQFPDIELPNPPPKDKSAANVTPQAQQGHGYSAYNPLRMIYGSGTSTPQSGNNTPSPRNSGETERPDNLDGSALPSTMPLAREKNRLTLRAYLQSIMSIPEIANAPVMRSFLLSAPTTLTPPEAADVQRRLEADAVREEGRRRFREEAERRVEALRGGLAAFKGDILSQEGGLKSVFDVVRRVERVEDLPPAEKSVLEWGRISFAATIFQIYVASDTASDSLASLKRLHGIMPYFMLKGILKISNPMAMIRGILDLFLARPFGGQSLLQKMFSTSLTEDLRYLAEDIAAVQDKIDDPVLCQKVEQYVRSSWEAQEVYRKEAVSENCELLTAILRSPEAPTLSRGQIQRVFRASRAYRDWKAEQAEYDDSDDEEGPDNDDAWLFEDLNILLKLMMRKKEKEAMLALIFEGVTAELLKDIITIFYAPLATVYKAASIADSLGDLQAFINDMIRTVEHVEELSQEDPQRTVQTFIDLVQRHEQAFYTFVHNVHTKGQGLFDSLMGWIELFLGYARTGLETPLDLEILLPMGGPDRAAIMAEVDAVAQYHYKLKVAHEEKVRRRFQSGLDQATAEEAQLVDSVMQSLSLGDTTVGAAEEVADEESEEEYDDQWEDSETSSIVSGTSSLSLNTAAAGAPPPPGTKRTVPPSPLAENNGRARAHGHGHRRGGSNGSQDPPPLPPKDGNVLPVPPKAGQPQQQKRRRRKRRVQTLQPPKTPHLDALRPLFVEAVKPLLKVRPIKT